MVLDTHVATELKESSLTQGITAVYVIVVVVNLSTVATDRLDVAFLSKALLMPLLAAWMFFFLKHFAQPITKPVKLLFIGLLFAWLGDLTLTGEGDAWFAIGLVCFLVMQLLYILAFRAIEGPGLLRAWPLAWIPFAVLWLAMNAILFGHTGAMTIPVLIYSAALVLMAAQALDLVIRVDRRYGWITFLGAMLFVASDAALALSAFGVLEPSRGIAIFIMASYSLAQAMIVVGVTYALTYRAVNTNG